MRPLLHPLLINGRFGDPVLYIETLFERRALLFDLGDIAALPARKILRVEAVCVSHTHVDHFIGFDHLLRLNVGRAKTIRLWGPDGFIDQVAHKLAAYRWNLGPGYKDDLVFMVAEIASSGAPRAARFRLQNGFAIEPLAPPAIAGGVIHVEPTFRITTALLDHKTPCLAYAIEEAAHVNVWKNRLEELALPVGPWLKDLKRAVLEGRGDDVRIPVSPGPSEVRDLPLGAVRSAVTVTPGQKIAYVTDVADTGANRAAIVALARDADVLFIDAAFSQADAAIAAERAHLTTTAAGEIARAAVVRHVEPFHFSARYTGEETRMIEEVQAAFAGG